MANIKLFNRYGDNIYLECEDPANSPNIFTLKGKLDYMRIGFDPEDNSKLDFIDPSGGPYMSVGYFKLEDGRTLTKIEEDESHLYKLTFA